MPQEKAETVDTENAPIISGFFPDPSICRVGADYYLTTSSFEYFPGAPIFHSTDLRTWNQIGNILTRRSQFVAGDRRSSGGIFASTLRHHDERFWLVTTNMSDFGGGHMLLSAENPQGPWSDPVQIPGTKGIDPDIAWDESGNCFLTWVGFGPGENESGIVQARLDHHTGKLLEAPRRIWQGSGLAYPEGPHLYQTGRWWYLLLAEGGTERGHGVSVSRSLSPQGPFEAHPRNPIFSHRSTASSIQNVGHADLVENDDGSWAAVYLGVRPRGSTPSFHVIGRETFLAGLNWDAEWPTFDENHYNIAAAENTFADDFSAKVLHPRWVSPGDDPSEFTSPTDDGLAIHGASTPGSRTRILSTRVRDLLWAAKVRCTPLDLASIRLQLRIDDRHSYAIEADGHDVRVIVRIGQLCQTVAKSDVLSTSEKGADFELEIRCTDAPRAGQLGANLGPDEIQLGFRQGGQFVRLASLDGRYISTEVAAGYTGRFLGVSASNGTVIVRRFDYMTTDPIQTRPAPPFAGSVLQRAIDCS